MPQDLGDGPRGEHVGTASTPPVDRGPVAPGRPRRQAIPENEGSCCRPASPWLVEVDERTDIANRFGDIELI